MPSLFVFGVDRSSSTLLYQAIRDALPFPLAIHDTRYSQQLEFAAADPHLNKVLAATAPVFEADVAELHTFDEHVLVVRDPIDALAAEVLGRLADLAKHLDDAGFESLVAEVWSVDDPRLADLDAIARTRSEAPPAVEAVATHFGYCDEIARAYRDSCTVLRLEDVVAGEATYPACLRDVPVARPSVIAPHLWYSAALGTPRLASAWLTKADLEALPTGWDDAARRLGAVAEIGPTPTKHLPVDELTGSLERERNLVAEIPLAFDTLRDREVYTDDYVGHVRAAIGDGYEGAMIEFALVNLYGYVDANNTQDQYVRWMRAAMRRQNPSAMIHWGIALERLLASDREHRASHYFACVAGLIGNRAAKRRIEITRELYDANGFPNRER